MKTAAAAARFALLLALVFAGCAREIVFENEVPGATLEDLRWVTSDGAYPEYGYQSVGSLQPGERSAGITIFDDRSETGVIEFELVANGRRVALTTTNTFHASGDSTVFTIAADTPTKNRVVDGAGP